MTQENEFIQSSGNVFADLEVENPEEEIAKAHLALNIRRLIQERSITQKQAANILGTDQGRVSDLMNGKVSGFTFDRLLRFITALDRDVQIVIASDPAPQSKATVRVVTAS